VRTAAPVPTRRPLPPCRPRGPLGHYDALYCGPAVLVIDELGYLPMQAEAVAALFEVVQRRYPKGSIILTTNRGIASWGQVFDDPMIAAAMLDRLLHRSIVLRIDGESYRLRAHRAKPAAASRLESMRVAQSANWLSSSRRLRSWAKRSRPSM
jgi:hypothetical protein